MLNTIVIKDEADEATLSSLKDAGMQVTLLSSAREFQARTLPGSGMVTIVDGSLSPNAEEITKILEAARRSDTVTVFTTNGAVSCFDVEDLSSAFAPGTRWGIAALVAPAPFVQLLLKLESSGTQELMARILINAISENRAIESVELERAGEASFSSSERAQCLRSVVGAFNIEELFPSHAWESHEAESLAASYHALAALFIKLDDTDSAMQCLSLSDQFEDSPRSLALKGIIALIKGEVLGAVANMVSSLQQYELRKNPNEGHYLSFEPSDIESVNSTLRAGLQALNQRDNQGAFEHFTKAVTSFDPFYQRFGLVDKSGSIQ